MSVWHLLSVAGIRALFFLLGGALKRGSGPARGEIDLLGKVHYQLGELQEAARQMRRVGEEIASLQELFRSPKLRGGFGETLLAELLRQVLPEDRFALQYAFCDGTRADAVLFLQDAPVAVDAKFPLENFKRLAAASEPGEFLGPFRQDVKRHIDEIARKYIAPAEGTLDFAFLYVPSEALYYEMIMKDEGDSLADYAASRKVVPVSPHTFYAYLQALLRGFGGARLGASVQKVLAAVGQLDLEIRKLRAEFDKLGAHLSHTRAAYERADKGLGRLGERVGAMGSESPLEAAAQEIGGPA